MAFTSAAGYGGLPNGAFSPTIFSQKALKAFRKTSVVEDITNTDYFGEISAYGDTVKIIKEPDIQVQAYTRGQQVIAQNLNDDETSLTVDKANYFAFVVDDIETKQSHVNWEDLASNRAAYKLKDAYDSEVLTYMSTMANTTNTVGAAGSPKVIALSGTYDFTPLGILNRINRLFDSQNVPTDSRFFVADPFFWELMGDENSKLMNRDWVGPGETEIRNGRVSDGKIRNFTCYVSNNLPYNGTGPDSTNNSNSGVLIAGHMSSVATATQITKTETYRSPDTFGDVVRGMHLYGRKCLRPEALSVVTYRRN